MIISQLLQYEHLLDHHDRSFSRIDAIQCIGLNVWHMQLLGHLHGAQRVDDTGGVALFDHDLWIEIDLVTDENHGFFAR